MGADIVVNHHTTRIDQFIAEKTDNGVDVYWETQRQPNFETSVAALAENGRMVVMAGRDACPPFPVGPFYVKGCSLVGFAMFKASPKQQLQSAHDINSWAEAGQLKANIGRRFHLSEAAAAHQLQEENTIHSAGTLYGKIVLTP